MKIAILGGGSWGSALAIHLAQKEYSINLWEFVKEQATKMQQERFCPLLPDTKLPENIQVSSDLETVLSNIDLVFIAVPSDKVEQTMKSAASHLQNQPIIICSKGFGTDQRFLSDIVAENCQGEVYCLYGPTHAEELCKGMFSGIVLAGKGEKKDIKEILQTDSLHVDCSEDLIGVQVAAALKNILAVLVGILHGAGYGDNTVAFVLTKGLQEIKDVGLALGSKEATFYGLAGLGDVIVTCGSEHSRNRHVGKEVGQGKKLADVIAEMNMVAEGVSTAEQIPQLQQKTHVRMPLLLGVHDILFKGKKVEEMFASYQAD